jgi:hypothetical protein
LEVLDPKVMKLSKRALVARVIFFTTRIIAVLGSASLPFLIPLGESWKTASIIISILITLSIALEEAIKFKEIYIKYDSVVNMVNKLKGHLIADAAEFEILNEKEKEKKFIQLSEDLISSAHQSLLDMIGKFEPPKKVSI